MITYFGNEIVVSSDRLSYNLYESDWRCQPESTKKCIIIFGERLKKPQVLLIGKLYPLTLRSFNSVCSEQNAGVGLSIILNLDFDFRYCTQPTACSIFYKVFSKEIVFSGGSVVDCY